MSTAENGTEKLNGESVVMTPDEFESMTDASDPPKGGARPKARARPAKVGTPVEIQAARDEIYERKQVPAPLRPIFDRLPPEEIIFVVAHVEHAYRSGIAAGTAHGGTECGHETVMAKYNDVIAGLLKSVSFLEGEEPNVEAALRHADKAYQRLQAP
jgi:hypothetical protein